ncbi:MAG: DUF465 domain-containing protein [Candidatus Aminicenantes bacterium]|nr:DUF465 domain-containing protein [Candidatus Aminicenantes bacterium]MDE2926548.1 DUF465 domain-containing protein [Acidobacteriota bacterium]
MDEAALKSHLMETDKEFSRLALEHQGYERQLEELVRRVYLNPEEKLRESVIKKKKLALKDQMQVIIHRHRMEAQTG